MFIISARVQFSSVIKYINSLQFVDIVEIEVVSYTKLYTVLSVAHVAAVIVCQCAGFHVEICRILYQLLFSRAAVQNCQLIFVLIYVVCRRVG